MSSCYWYKYIKASPSNNNKGHSIPLRPENVNLRCLEESEAIIILCGRHPHTAPSIYSNTEHLIQQWKKKLKNCFMRVFVFGCGQAHFIINIFMHFSWRRWLMERVGISLEKLHTCWTSRWCSQCWDWHMKAEMGAIMGRAHLDVDSQSEAGMSISCGTSM